MIHYRTFLAEAETHYQANKSWCRKGQAYANWFSECLGPGSLEVSEMIHTDADPFYNDENLPAFRAYCREVLP